MATRLMSRLPSWDSPAKAKASRPELPRWGRGFLCKAEVVRPSNPVGAPLERLSHLERNWLMKPSLPGSACPAEAEASRLGLPGWGSSAKAGATHLRLPG